MKNPYEILGVRTNATEDEIKDAYRALVQKYHPDKYVNNPLADLASEKLQEINWAYDELFKNRGSYSASGQQGQYASFNQVRSLINDNRLGEAVNALNSMAVRNAEWHYLMGVIMQKRGWHDMAYQHFSVACKSDPYNEEYRSAKANMDMRRSTYTTQSYNEGYPQGGCSTCDFCQGLLCADCCCECMGGDLISCC